MFEGATLINKGEDFRLGTRENVELNHRGELVLQEQKLKGSYISPEIDSYGFKNLVASWNAETPEGTEIEVSFKVKSEEEWSKWFSYGKWSSHGPRGSIKEQSDEIVRMDTDTLILINEKESNGFKYRVIMSREDSETESPKVKLIAAALNLSEAKELQLDESKGWVIDLDVPVRAQLPIPKIGNIICSPTSLSMVMEYYGVKIDTEEVAANVLDNGMDIYGNWSYNVAYAGSKGFTSYVSRFASINEIKDKIANGIPLVASIRTKAKEELTGAIMAYPGGHLIVVRGFIVKDGEEYVIVNDPAEHDLDNVRREYKLSEFEKAWGKIVYILIPDSK